MSRRSGSRGGRLQSKKALIAEGMSVPGFCVGFGATVRKGLELIHLFTVVMLSAENVVDPLVRVGGDIKP